MEKNETSVGGCRECRRKRDIDTKLLPEFCLSCSLPARKPCRICGYLGEQDCHVFSYKELCPWCEDIEYKKIKASLENALRLGSVGATEKTKYSEP